MTLPGTTAARLYSRTSGCLFLVLAGLSITFFAGLAWFGIDASGFVSPWYAVGVLGLALLIARGLRVLLLIAAAIGVASAGFWTFLWVTSEGIDWPTFVILIGPSLGASAIALRGWMFLPDSN
jgi:hypothetical protein